MTATASPVAATAIPTEPKPKLALGALQLGSFVYVSLTPTGTASVIVKYDPEVQISCVIPPREYEIAYGIKGSSTKKTMKIKAPTLVMSCGYGDVPTPETFRRVASGYGLYVMDETRTEQVWAKPYLLANVWERGAICFGSLQPTSLRQAFSYYWASGFNSDLLRVPHHCKKADHQYYSHNGCRCQRILQHDCECPNEIVHYHDGCGCFSITASKKCRGTCGADAATDANQSCICCQAIDAYKQVLLTANAKLGKAKLKGLLKNPIDQQTQKKLSIFPGACQCQMQHKKSCACKKGQCSCPCQCKCCQKQCSHAECRCQCCRGLCGCPCNCTPLQRLAQHLTDYNDNVIKEKGWDNLTATICGTRWWASPKAAEGVLVSNNQQLLKQIPRDFWRKDKHGQPIIIALATKSGENWVFESGSFTFELPGACVITK